jgi:hypothetical protein
MDNKYVFVVMAAVMATIMYYLSHMPYFADADGNTSNVVWYAWILAVGLGAGNTGGTDVVSILVEGLKGYVGTMINLAIFGVITSIAVGMGLGGEAFDAMGTVQTAVSFVMAGTMLNLVLSYLKKAA